MKKHPHFPYPITESDYNKIVASELAYEKTKKETDDYIREYKKTYGYPPKFA